MIRSPQAMGNENTAWLKPGRAKPTGAFHWAVASLIETLNNKARQDTAFPLCLPLSIWRIFVLRSG